MIDDVENLLLAKYANTKTAQKIQAQREQRLLNKNKYIRIREELIDILNKTLENDAKFVDLYKVRHEINKCIKENYSVYDAVYYIYGIMRAELDIEIKTNKITCILDRMLRDIFGNDWTKLIYTNIYTKIIKDCIEQEEIDPYLKSLNINELFQTKLDQKNRKEEIEEYIKYLKSGVGKWTNRLDSFKNDYIDNKITLEECKTNIDKVAQKYDREAQIDDKIFKIDRNNYGHSLNEYNVKNHIKSIPIISDYINGITNKINWINKVLMWEIAVAFLADHKRYLIQRYLRRKKFEEDFNNMIIGEESIINYINDLEYHDDDHQYLSWHVQKYIKTRHDEYLKLNPKNE